MDEFEKIYNMTYEQAALIIGDIPIVPIGKDWNYSVAEYQTAKMYAIKILLDLANKKE